MAIIGPASWNLLVRLEKLPQSRPHTVIAQWHHEALGGTSAGKAMNLRQLGVEVSVVTVVGNDDAGQRILSTLRAAGVTVLSRESANGSERHVNLMDGSGRRLSIHLARPDLVAGAADIAAVMSGADAVVVDLAEHARSALAVATKDGLPIWCDLHDYDGHSDFHREFLDAATNVFVSAERLPDPESFLREQIGRGKRLVVCTDGARGAVALERGGQLVHVAAHAVPRVVDTNGAGDAFFAGYLRAHLADEPMAECLRQAARAGATCVETREMAAPSLNAALVQSRASWASPTDN